MRVSKKKYFKLFGKEKPVIGMVHIAPTPGAPLSDGNVKKIIARALEDAKILIDAGVDSLMIENMHDVPYLNRSVGPEVTAIMSVVALELRKLTSLPLGIQILAGANKEALAVAKAAEFNFIRAEGFVFSHVADEGLMNSDAGELLRYRKQIAAEDVLIFTDVKKKHSAHSITADVNLEETIKAAEFFLSDGVIITGKATGEQAEFTDVKLAYSKSKIPVLIGSGLTPENIQEYLPFADGFIVGSYFKKDGKWFNSPDKKRVTEFLKAMGK